MRTTRYLRITNKHLNGGMPQKYQALKEIVPVRSVGKYWTALDSSTDNMLQCSRGVDVALRGMRLNHTGFVLTCNQRNNVNISLLIRVFWGV